MKHLMDDWQKEILRNHVEWVRLSDNRSLSLNGLGEATLWEDDEVTITQVSEKIQVMDDER